MKFVSRQQWQALPSKNLSVLNAAELDGMAVHHGDSASPDDHSLCAAVVRSFQSLHMHGRGWNDIAYSFVVCRHGYVYEGRGWGIRTAANGTTVANSSYHAVCLIGSGSREEHVTTAAKTAIAQVIAEGQQRYPRALFVKPHSAFTATSCPGEILRQWVVSGGWRVKQRPTVGQLRKKVVALVRRGWKTEAIKRTRWWKALERRRR